jgi:hypothetical protein
MLSGDTVAIAMVFGKNNKGTGTNTSSVPNCVFNRNDYGSTSNVNTLLPAVESDWPDNSTLVQNLVIVPGAPSDVETRAANLVDGVQPPHLIVPPAVTTDETMGETEHESVKEKFTEKIENIASRIWHRK